MRYVAEVRFIGSIYPGELEIVRRFYGPSIHASGKGAERVSRFALKPVPRGEKPFILPIHDSFEEVLDVMALSATTNNPVKPTQSKPVPVEQIVTDLIEKWTGNLANVPSGAKPGVSEVHLLDRQVAEYQRTGALPDSVLNSKLSGIPQDEYDQLVQQQTSYFEYWFGQGELLHDQKKFDQISPIMRLAADWLGHRRPWTNKDWVVENVACPFCTELVPEEALFCPRCRNQIKLIPPDRADLAALLKQQAGR